MGREVYSPIFFIGVPRSGTTIIFEAFSTHEKLAWFSNRLSNYPKLPIVSLLSRMTTFNRLRGAKKQISRQSWLKSRLPYPAECYPVWEMCSGKKFLFDFLINQNASEDKKRKVTKLISKVMKYHGKKRFATKITGPSRIHYLNSIFPDAIFIHIIRDGRAVTNSLMNVKFWKERGGYNRPWWHNGLKTSDICEYEQYGKSPLALAAIQWRRIIQIARSEASNISAGRYYEVNYENFMLNPHIYMGKILEITDLGYSPKVTKYMKEVSKFKSQNYKYLKSISTEDLDMLNSIVKNVKFKSKYTIQP